MTSALITGATSHLGVRLTDRLGEEGVTTHAIVRPTSDTSGLDELSSSPFLHVHDGSTEGLIDTLESIRPDVVFHLATSYRREHEVADVVQLVRSNVEFGTQLLEGMRRTEGGRLVNVGSYFQMYQGSRPLNLYAATKSAFDAVVDYYRDAFAIEAVTLVLYDLYGPGDHRGKLMSVIQQAQQSGEALPIPEADPILDLVFVDDAVSAFVHAARLLEEGTDVSGRHFAVRSPERHKLREVVALFEEVARRPIKRIEGGLDLPPRQILDPWQGEALPGWEPQVSLREGIRRMLNQASASES